MRLLSALLRTLVESDPTQIAKIPTASLLPTLLRLLDQDDVYLVEQVTKQVDVIGLLPGTSLSAAAERALGTHRVDDFCFIHKRLPPSLRPADDRVQRAHCELLLRGNAAGVEQLAKQTGVLPVVDESTARRAYAALAATGRPGAIDYVRQLSGVPVQLRPEDLYAGVHVLLGTGRHEAMLKLAGFNHVGLRLDSSFLRRAVDDALRDGTLAPLAAAARAWGSDRSLVGFNDVLRECIESGQLRGLPALFSLFADAATAAVPDTVWSRLAEHHTPDVLRFLLAHHPDDAAAARLGPQAQAVALAQRDRELLQLACTRGGMELSPSDASALIEDAFDAVDLPWLSFVASRIDPLPPVPADVIQLFLAEIEDREPSTLELATSIVGSAYDEARAPQLLALVRGDRAAADRFLTELSTPRTNR